MSGNESAEPDATPLRRLRVECVAGPWWDGAPCVRWIDVPVTAKIRKGFAHLRPFTEILL